MSDKFTYLFLNYCFWLCCDRGEPTVAESSVCAWCCCSAEELLQLLLHVHLRHHLLLLSLPSAVHDGAP